MAEINVIGNFEWASPLTLPQEVQLLDQTPNLWEPTTKDFEKVAGPKAIVASNFGDVLGAIFQNSKIGVERLNIFTHSNPNQIAFSGKLEPKTTMTDVILNVNRSPGLVALDSLALDRINEQGATFKLPRNSKDFTLKDVRSWFGGTHIFLYSCHSGGDEKFLQSIADTLLVIVTGFRPAIVYCPHFQIGPPASIDRRFIGLSACSLFPDNRDFKNLTDFADAWNSSWTITKIPRPFQHLPHAPLFRRFF